MKVIFHLDLDSYFASAARTVDKSLIGKPIAVTTAKRRSIISALSYEAKKVEGVHVPMPFYKAKVLCPELIPVEPNYALYTTLSNKLFELIANNITKKIEVGSIDECYIDVSDVWQKEGSPAKLAKKIQQMVLKELDLPCSIGIGSNKFVAKMSTQVNKPFGITSTPPGEFIKRFGDWDVVKIHGVGGPTSEILNKNNIFKIKELAQTSIHELKSLMGVRGEMIHNLVNEQGSDEINVSMNELKGIGNSMTFMDRDRSIRSEILEMIEHLCEMVAIRADNRNVAGHVISLMIKEKGGKEVKGIRKQITLKRPIKSKEDLLTEATRIFDMIWEGQS
ncbi:MAG: DNA polymerase IV, partial [Mycoplasmataceae bacterium]|nr:DNA polymerase IV [Mycoplasmataceae bacterium]